MYKAFGITVGAIAVLAAGFFVLNWYIYQEKQELNPVESYEASLQGQYVCLPHIDATGPQTLECAFGLKTDAGEYYALDFNNLPQVPADLHTGSRIQVTGVITPVELLSGDRSRQYPIDGIFAVYTLQRL